MAALLAPAKSARIVDPAMVLQTVWCLLIGSSFAIAPSVNWAGEQIDFATQIKPILKARCFACHGALKQESALRVDTAAALLQGGSSGRVVVPGNAQNGELLSRLRSMDSLVRMPPEGQPLTAEQIALIARWIEQGAAPPQQETPEPDPREHWSFRTPQRPAVPVLAAGESVANPIDAFILARLEQAALTPAPLADKSTWLRRVTLDLIGVPPTHAELQAFLADDSAASYQTVVDRLLNDSRYGERWARHWMDVWRYADWHGRRHVPDVWNSAPQVWRWRDWIVRSLNADHGYDRLVREMLAADEVAPGDDQAAVATAYLIRNWYALNPNDWMRANVEHVGKAFLGLTLNCAHCHDHKYDPITQEEYFRFRAFFEPIGIRQDRVAGEADPGPFQEYAYGVLRKIQRLGSVQVFDKAPQSPTWFYHGGDERNRDQKRGSIAPGVPAFLGDAVISAQPLQLPPLAWYPSLRSDLQETLLADQRTAIQSAETAHAAAIAQRDQALPALRQQLTAADTEYAAAKAAAQSSPRTGLLAGQQSLLLDARSGRRIVQQTMSHLAKWESGSRITFQLLILQDAHVNFQFAKDTAQGLTAAFIAFDQGKVISYQPGSFTEFSAGKYDMAAGHSRFAVSVDVDTMADRMLLSVQVLPDGPLVVDRVPIALNGWNPLGDSTKAISFDARTGSLAAIDEVTILGPADAADAREKLFYAGFEPPQHDDQQDVIGREGWQGSSFSVAPATSLVTSLLPDDATQQAATKLAQARQALATAEANVRLAEARVQASTAELASLSARIAAERMKYGIDKPTVANLPPQSSANAEKTVANAAEQTVDQPGKLNAGTDLPAGTQPTNPSPASSPTEPSQAVSQSGTTATAADTGNQAGEVAPQAAAQPTTTTETTTATTTAWESLAKEASRLQRTATLAAAEADRIAAEVALATAEAKPASDAKRAAEITAATQQLTQAKTAVEKAQAALNDPQQSLQYAPLGPQYPPTSTGRRQALVTWLTDRKQPLTARVAVNHIWLRHFHSPLVASVFDFGRNGAQPTHPELLDWLAVEFMEQGWSTKHLHRLIVTSLAYRRVSSPSDSPNAATDPENRLLWRMNVGRMEAEVVRDSLLYLAGQMDATMGGQELENDAALTTFRRSLYYSCQPEVDGKSTFGALFDAPEPADCYRRTRSVIPQQALALTNSDLVHKVCGPLATKISGQVAADQANSPASFVQVAFQSILGRDPSAAESAACIRFLEALISTDPAAAAPTNPQQQARESLVRVLLNHNDFIAIR